jgi:hypothetical protein
MGMTSVACFNVGTAIAFCDNDVDVEADKLGRDLGVALGTSLRPVILDRDGAPLDPAEFTESLHKSGSPWDPGRSVRAQEPDGRQLHWLLRLSGERRGEDSDRTSHERAPTSHSITSSARANTAGGMVRPSALAVFMLMISSNFVGCSMGRVAGFAPLRIRST